MFLCKGVLKMIMGLIMSLISYFKFKSLLKKCLVDNSFDGSTFEYKGKNYDKNKYIELRVKAMYQLKPRHFREIAKKANKEIEKGIDIEQNKAELEAIKTALKKYYPKETID